MSTLDVQAVRKAYARWAPVYDYSFGAVSDIARRSTVRLINQREGRVLEAGVGTGMTLPTYRSHLRITGIDLSPNMLEKARDKVERHDLTHVDGIFEMDAGELTFPDGHFETVAAMFLLPVVPSPGKVMHELERVCAPGGELFILNHFAREGGLRGQVEQWMVPMNRLVGWRSDFEVSQVLSHATLELKEVRHLFPFGLFTLMRFEKPANN